MAFNCLLPAASVILAGLLISYSNGDVYLHNPRGSNNRLNGADANRQNNNRLFDSQNNAKGGYNVGINDSTSTSEDGQFNMHYFQSGRDYRRIRGWIGKSVLAIEWTNQHGCNDRDLHCNFVLQYRCQDDTKHQTLNSHSMRNGEKTDTPVYNKKAYSSRSQKDQQLQSDSDGFSRGLHESWEWYDKCTKRKRSDLFTADQQLNGDTTIYTRQNANGARSGYECPEERDYYPYWHPTDWTDIAVFTHSRSMCFYYRRESFNVKPKEECLQYYSSKNDGFRHDSSISNKVDCENNGGFWVSFRNYLEEYPKYQTEAACKGGSTRAVPLIWAIPYRSEEIDNLKIVGDNVESLKRCLVALAPPECWRTPYTRSNHLGNARGVVPVRYYWVIPNFPSGKTQRCVIRLRYNISTGDYPPFHTFGDKNDDPGNGVNSPVKNNPTVKVGKVQLPLQLAINTAQFGRTFQDRSHLFKLLPRPPTVSRYANIHNLNVRGKRGNIVQAYPAVEYDFIPKRLKIRSTSLVHIQWTGSDTNPQGNAGQGTAGTDRNNIVEMKNPSVNYPLSSSSPSRMFTNANIVWSSSKDTKTGEDLITSMASAGYYDSVSHYSTKTPTLSNLLNNAPASYRGMLLKFAPGVYNYMCTRNNNFSNRNQKGRLTVYGRRGRK